MLRVTRVTLYAALFAISFGITAKAEIIPMMVPVNFHTGYFPQGFDTNDNVQLIAEGTFPSSCYKPAAVDAIVDNKKKEIRVYPRAFKYNTICTQMLVNWHRELDVGLLKAGTYKIINDDRSGKIKELGSMTVNAATVSTPDDFPYAPVSQAFFEQLGSNGYVTLTGEFPSKCYKMREVITRVQTNVIVIQPISEKIDEDCSGGPVSYSERVEVSNLPLGRYLLHVRSLNGRAVNSLVDFR